MTERVITVGIGQVLLASATRGLSSNVLIFCSGAPVAKWVRASDSKGPGFNTQLGSNFFFGVSLLSHILLPSLMICIVTMSLFRESLHGIYTNVWGCVN